MTAWKLPLIVVALVVPIVAGFAVGGSGVGLAAGALTVFGVLLVAARQRPRGPIGAAPAEGAPAAVLLVATCALEHPAAVARVVAESGLGAGDGARAQVLAPARIRFLDRWASDVEPSRQAAQRNLVATVAALAKAGVEAEARVGDEDVVQAVEDQLQTYTATEVVLVGESGDDGLDAAAAELEERLAAGFRRLEI